MFSKTLRSLRPVLLGTALIAAGSAAQAQQILTAVESEQGNPYAADTQVTNIAGKTLTTTFGGAETRALTDYGVNKIYSRGTAEYEQYATSAWVDTFTVGGAAGTIKTVSFTFSVDGLANFDPETGAGFNFNVYALRGGNWSMSGTGDDYGPNWYSPVPKGDNYDRLMLTQTLSARVTNADARDFEGFSNYGNNGSNEPGGFQSNVTYVEAGEYFRVINFQNTPQGPRETETRYFSTAFQQFQNGVPTTPLLPYAVVPSQGVVRTNLQNNYSLLDMAQLCLGDECEDGVWPGSDLTLSFNLAAGSTFSLASYLYADDLTEGTIDFFHTAKVSGISVSNGGTLTSLSGALVELPGGGYGYPSAQAGVPEPASWAMMIGGFALAGGAARRRKKAAFVLA